MTDDRTYAPAARAWPFEEAKKLVERYKAGAPKKGYVLFETGYGPSGLPHIGTFGEVVRTTMVRQAFQRLSDIPTRLFAFSDDMDGLRKVPTNVPNQEMLAEFLGKPLTRVPDPFDKYESFGHHNNAMLRGFLDSFGFEYEFQSSTDWYMSGRFDQGLLDVLRHYQEVQDIMLPSLREERAASYSPFLPVCQKTGRVLQVPVLETNADAGTIVYQDEDGSKVETPVTGGRCKLQWKPDWAMRWHVLGVDYEMSGKDLIPSVQLAGKICRKLGSPAPEGFNYELFLDEKGQKISKSKGNGLSVEEWLEYAPPESLALFMYQKPRAAKRLYFDVIPRAVDDYLTFTEKFAAETPAQRLENPAWHIHNGNPPTTGASLPYGILLNLASVANAEAKETLWGFISRYLPEATPASAPFLDKLVGYAINYYRDHVKPHKQYRAPDAMERKALEDLLARLDAAPADASAEDLQNIVYEVGKQHPFPELRAWFKTLYEVLLGQETGPRMGTFIALYGKAETAALIRQALSGRIG
ncbi:lysyl-tRNA synthetase class I [Dongia mobilis]|uniref:Lysine--tRNA ligase n=1 Tax=Dongia mobilis TaxID=578943 RepID=A0A4R6WTY6_9PROT|nr:lysine--tRNA ligase [Dongia mobilis]TDQ83133.1 lysyl-tRNA synthetase class I [Dongia mobilis]